MTSYGPYLVVLICKPSACYSVGLASYSLRLNRADFETDVCRTHVQQGLELRPEWQKLSRLPNTGN